MDAVDCMVIAVVHSWFDSSHRISVPYSCGQYLRVLFSYTVEKTFCQWEILCNLCCQWEATFLGGPIGRGNHLQSQQGMTSQKESANSQRRVTMPCSRLGPFLERLLGCPMKLGQMVSKWVITYLYIGYIGGITH